MSTFCMLLVDAYQTGSMQDPDKSRSEQQPAYVKMHDPTSMATGSMSNLCTRFEIKGSYHNSSLPLSSFSLALLIRSRI